MRRRTTIATALAVIAAVVLLAAPTASADPPVATYEVTISNLTGGQPFTPPAIAVHRRAADLFDVGAPASFAVKEIAENGNLMPMLAALAASHHVYDWAVVADGNADPAPIMPGSSQPFTLEAATGAKFLSFVSMLICTNDGFTGLDSLRLPDKVGESATVYSSGYDAGTEINTEDFADMVPPCPALTGVASGDTGTGESDSALAENGVIHHHPGIAGGVDLLEAVHDWTNPVASIHVERIG